tara:strand:+ start:68075 stop:68743 length:669 start_codon:yes stop_codon:yes gene_type:complete
MSVPDGIDIALALMVGGFVGARLMHILYEFPDYYIEDPMAVFRFWQGGFVFYGGALGGFFSALAVIRIKKMDFYAWAEVYAPIAPLGYALGRLACFFNGCCYGHKCDLPWAMQFPLVDGLRHPTQLYATGLELVLFGIVLGLSKMRLKGQLTGKTKAWLEPSGQLLFLWIMGHSINRIIMESFRDDFRGSDLFGLSVSTWISIALFFSASTILLKRKREWVL